VDAYRAVQGADGRQSKVTAKMDKMMILFLSPTTDGGPADGLVSPAAPGSAEGDVEGCRGLNPPPAPRPGSGIGIADVTTHKGTGKAAMLETCAVLQNPPPPTAP